MSEIELYSFHSHFVLPFTMRESDDDEANFDILENYHDLITEVYICDMNYWFVKFYEEDYDIYLEPKLDNWKNLSSNISIYIEEVVKYLKSIPIVKLSSFGYQITDKTTEEWKHFDIDIQIEKSVIKINVNDTNYEFTR